MIDDAVITARRAYTKKSIIPFMSKWEYQLKDRKDRFTTGNCGISSTFRSAANNAASMNLTTAAAIVSIF